MKKINLSIVIILIGLVNPAKAMYKSIFNDYYIESSTDTLRDTIKVYNKYKIKMSRIDFDSIENYYFPSIKQFDSIWIRFKDSKSPSPAIVTSDFNGDRITDYALLLKHKNKQIILFCVLLSDLGKYKLFKIKQFELKKKTIPFVLNIEAKGVWERALDKGINVKNDGIGVCAIDYGYTLLYYYKNGKFVLFVGD